jgi:hypothetical protein
MSLLAKLKSLFGRGQPASLGETEKATTAIGVNDPASPPGPPPPAPPAGN